MKLKEILEIHKPIMDSDKIVIEEDMYERVTNGIDFNVKALDNFRRKVK